MGKHLNIELKQFKLKKFSEMIEVNQTDNGFEVTSKRNRVAIHWRNMLAAFVYLCFIERKYEADWDSEVIVGTGKYLRKGRLKDMLSNLHYGYICLFIDFRIIKVSPND